MAYRVFLLIGIVFALKLTVQVHSDDEFKCPKNQFYLFPCRCLSGGYKGLDLLCNNSNLATLALALGNVKDPINSLVIANSNITRLFGTLFKDKSVHALTFQQSNLKEIEDESLSCLKQDIRTLQLDGNQFRSIPESINVLLNLTRVAVSGTAPLTEVSGGAFKRLVNLVELDLHNNSINKIDSATFTPLTVLGKYHKVRANCSVLIKMAHLCMHSYRTTRSKPQSTEQARAQSIPH
jgi:Leucine-rich repeat (LRR) protein